jgi:hypothetical protein
MAVKASTHENRLLDLLTVEDAGYSRTANLHFFLNRMDGTKEYISFDLSPRACYRRRDVFAILVALCVSYFATSLRFEYSVVKVQSRGQALL